MTANDAVVKKVPNMDEFDWLELRKDMGTSHYGETAQDKFIRKIKENPFVPIGCLTTAGVLSFGLYTFRSRQERMSQNMMRMRIFAQGITVVAVLVGVIAGTSK